MGNLFLTLPGGRIKRLSGKPGGEKAWRQHFFDKIDGWCGSGKRQQVAWPPESEYWPDTPMASVLGIEVPNAAPIAAACFDGLNGSFRGQVRLHGATSPIKVKW